MLKYIIIISVPVCIFGKIYALEVIVAFFGQEFSQAAFAFQVLIWSIVFTLANILNEFTITSLHREKFLIASNGGCFLLNCLLNLILVSDYGYMGASVASVFACFLQFSINLYFITRILGGITLYHTLIQPLMANGVMLVLFYLFAAKIHFVVLSLGVLMTYLAVLLLSKTITPAELIWLKSLVVRRKNVSEKFR